VWKFVQLGVPKNDSGGQEAVPARPPPQAEDNLTNSRKPKLRLPHTGNRTIAGVVVDVTADVKTIC
jgi:hypothetical protein